jgi:hypothetical protein
MSLPVGADVAFWFPSREGLGVCILFKALLLLGGVPAGGGGFSK